MTSRGRTFPLKKLRSRDRTGYQRSTACYLARDAHGMPSMFNVVMNTLQTLQYELGNFKAISADVRINPDLSAYTWIEFYRALELIERGAEAAERALPEIKRVLAERLRAPARG